MFHRENAEPVLRGGISCVATGESPVLPPVPVSGRVILVSSSPPVPVLNRRIEYQRALFGAALAALIWSPFLLSAGSFTTTIGAGMAFLDWPLSDGSLNPDRWLEERDAFAEHSHRLSAKVLGILAIGLAGLFYFFEGRKRVRWLAVALPFLILVQGILGGLRVLLDPLNEAFATPYVARSFAILHAVGAQGILICLVLLALVASPFWFRHAERLGVTDREGGPTFGGLRPFGIVCWALLLATIVMGAVVRHSHAGLAIPWFPQATHGGSWVPDVWTYGIAVHYIHRTLGMVAGLLALGFVWRYWSVIQRSGPGKWTGVVFIAALMLQIALGALIVDTMRGVWVTTIHMLNGALLFSAFSVLTLLVQTAPQRAPAGPRSVGVEMEGAHE